jgi:hypothetical protein
MIHLKKHNLFYKKSIANDHNDGSSEFEVVCINNPQNNNDVFFSKDLNVYHKYYQKDFYPWEYPNEALFILCWHCHEELHENTEIAIFDENEKPLERKSWCHKCHGAGFISEYSTVLSGIYSACNGERFNKFD